MNQIINIRTALIFMAAMAACMTLPAARCSCEEQNKSTAAGSADNTAGSAITVYIACDPHHLSTSISDGGEALMKVLENGDGKIVQYSTQVLSAFIETVLADRPDLVILPGDLTFNGEKASHEDIAAMLSSIKTEGIPVLVIPGNHDLNCTNARTYEGDQILPADTLSPEEFADLYADFGYRDAYLKDPDSLSYVWKMTETLWFLMIDVNTPEAPGLLTENTCNWAETVLQEAQKLGAKVIGVSHQNLLAHNRIFFDGFRMGYAGRLLELYKNYRVMLNLSGHMHLQHIASEEGVTDIATSSLMVSPLHYGRLILDPDGTYSYEAVPAITGKPAAYAADFFDTSSTRSLTAGLDQAEVPEDIKKEMIRETAWLNRCYFSGHMDEYTGGDTLLSLWKKYDPTGFTQIYLMSILQDDIGNMTKAEGTY